jgi:hypothetical protein
VLKASRSNTRQQQEASSPSIICPAILGADMAKRRLTIPTGTQTALLTQSRRRCCLCFGLKGDIEVKHGQIAHLDRNPANHSLGNLVWLCLPHHDEYDSIRRQTKRITADEVKVYRHQLYEQLAKPPFAADAMDEPTDFYDDSDIALSVIHRYANADVQTRKVIAAEILTRIEQIYRFYRLQEAEMQSLDRLSEDQVDGNAWEIHQRLREQLGLPPGIHALGAEGPLTPRWFKSARRLAKKWIAGELSYEQCRDVLWIFDEEHDLDPHYMLYGLPNESISRLQMRGLKAFIFEFGQRNFIPQVFQDSVDVPF